MSNNKYNNTGRKRRGGHGPARSCRPLEQGVHLPWSSEIIDESYELQNNWPMHVPWWLRSEKHGYNSSRQPVFFTNLPSNKRRVMTKTCFWRGCAVRPFGASVSARWPRTYTCGFPLGIGQTHTQVKVMCSGVLNVPVHPMCNPQVAQDQATVIPRTSWCRKCW